MTHTTILRALGISLLLAVLMGSSLDAQPAGPSADPRRITPTLRVSSSPPAVRTSEDMSRDESSSPGPAAASIPYRSTLGRSGYASAKSAAARRAIAGQRPGLAQPAPLAPPTLKGINREGVNQSSACGTCRPPDTHGAVGSTQFVEIVNQRVVIFDKASPPSQLKSVSLASFFGYAAQPLFDPRVIYDRVWKRWIVTAEAFPESATVQRHFVAVSKGVKATGAYFIYSFDVNFFDNGNFWDFPQLGMDQDAILVTANIFDASDTFLGADLFALAKARIYNGLPLSAVPVFTGLEGTLAPPIVLDQTAETFLVAAPPDGSVLKLYELRDSSRSGISLDAPVDVAVDAYTVPASAAQPGTGGTLDTGDSRFVNASTQVGSSLWQVHTVDFSGFPTPRWYRIDTDTETVAETGTFFASATSYDFNASIVANESDDVFVTWTSTDPAAGRNAQVRFSGKRSVDVDIPAGSALFTSSTFYDPSFDEPERWGDYSAVTVDPANPDLAWIVNEKINSATAWGSRIGRIGF